MMFTDDDLPLPEDGEIQAAFPTQSGRHDIYAEAMRLVGAKRSKAALVALVNLFLLKNDNLRSQLAAAERERDSAIDMLNEVYQLLDWSACDCVSVALCRIREWMHPSDDF